MILYVLGGLVDVIIGYYGSRLHLLLTLASYPSFCLNIIIIFSIIVVVVVVIVVIVVVGVVVVICIKLT